jgi:hypothetical protein
MSLSHHRYAETIRHSLRDGFTTYSALSPAIGRSCHRRLRGVKGPLGHFIAFRKLHASVEASRPRGFVVHSGRIRLVRHLRPSHPAPNVRDDREAPLLESAGRQCSIAVSTKSKNEIFFARRLDTTGKSVPQSRRMG